MAISSAQRVRYDTLRSLGHAAIGAGYVAVGAAFSHPVRILKINNFTDANLKISFDGVTDNDVVAAMSAYVMDYASNRIEPVGQLEQPVGDRVYVKEEAAGPSTGNVYVTVVYAAAN